MVRINILGVDYFIDGHEIIRQDGTVKPLAHEIAAFEHVLNWLYKLDGWKETRTGVVRWSDK